ncbi:hypothetical protein NC653_000613 [Populus alba x Populus x berolinensis]|uniref:Uncharacterized protein n=2 Tax=Populus TaxID=3689 RepID=A0A4U5N9S3_POPAL|nr:hypothetical protein NC653_000613 [Populus alba x Populus x berolinensis]TKR79746.1 hypothetical protein D5086_0000270080 [Populus alba]
MGETERERGEWEQGKGTGEVELRGEGNGNRNQEERGMRTMQLGNYRNQGIIATERERGMGTGELGNYRNREGEVNGWRMGEWDGTGELYKTKDNINLCFILL